MERHGHQRRGPLDEPRLGTGPADARVLDDFAQDGDAVRELLRLVHKTIRRVGDDLERFKFNTALRR